MSLLQRFGYWLSIGLGLGLVPVAPGTFGSLLGPPLIWAIQTMLPEPGLQAYGFQAVIGVLLFLVGVPICDVGSRVLGRKDPGSVVFDEVVAFFVVFACLPVNFVSGVLGFVLFRIFDIAKPWPIRKLERLPEGWGVMADDIMAGVYACVSLLVLWHWVIPQFS
ncbi:MAG: phosphatidylglycerophosphatase A [Planctomycetaceae bacterium]|nr:phosphatidylglycerophosphatase A [Planctomycetaceae bacterium]MDG2387901.1 phosphatidylglycerophosphatase A [Planctomycetaceae bacterium]